MAAFGTLPQSHRVCTMSNFRFRSMFSFLGSNFLRCANCALISAAVMFSPGGRLLPLCNKKQNKNFISLNVHNKSEESLN